MGDIGYPRLARLAVVVAHAHDDGEERFHHARGARELLGLENLVTVAS